MLLGFEDDVVQGTLRSDDGLALSVQLLFVHSVVMLQASLQGFCRVLHLPEPTTCLIVLLPLGHELVLQLCDAVVQG